MIEVKMITYAFVHATDDLVGASARMDRACKTLEKKHAGFTFSQTVKAIKPFIYETSKTVYEALLTGEKITVK